MSSELHRFGIERGAAPDARQWGKLCDLLRAIVNNASLNIGSHGSEIISQPEVIKPAKPATEAAQLYGAFYSTFVDDDGHTWLQGGVVTGGIGNKTVTNIKVVDATGGPLAPGQHLVLTVTGAGDQADDVLLPVFDVSGATAAPGAVGPNNLPEIGSLPGTMQISLGTYTTDAFLPSAAGNILVRFCLGGFIPSRY